MANGFRKDKCDWYLCEKEPVLLMVGHPYGKVVLCWEHSQAVELAVEENLEFRHGIITGEENYEDF